MGRLLDVVDGLHAASPARLTAPSFRGGPGVSNKSVEAALRYPTDQAHRRC
jgi:hypothetical protein